MSIEDHLRQMIIRAPNAPEAGHLADVVNDMRELGAPLLKVLDCGDHYMALEGSHRLAAAALLGLRPVLDVFGPDVPINIFKLQIDLYELFTEEDELPARVLAEHLHDDGNVIYEFR